MTKKKDRFTGILLGLAVGDALGTTLEFKPRRPLDNLHTEMIGGGGFNGYAYLAPMGTQPPPVEPARPGEPSEEEDPV